MRACQQRLRGQLGHRSGEHALQPTLERGRLAWGDNQGTADALERGVAVQGALDGNTPFERVSCSLVEVITR